MTTRDEQDFHLLVARGVDPSAARSLLVLLGQAGLGLADARFGEFVCRWVNVLERPVPPEADTIVRTVTKSLGARSASATHWLEGLDPPPPPADIIP